MADAYKPGTVARVRYWGGDMVAIRRDRAWAGEKVTASLDEVQEIAPLVVLDLPEGALAGWHVVLQALREAQDKTAFTMTFGGLIEQIQRQAQPPKPKEPQGFAAVVLDARGSRWVRTHSVDVDEAWITGTTRRGWGDIDVVQVLSKGMPS